MPKGAATKEGVIKLVYPRGHVEIHREPITAGEVMKRNPRHCVARPDIFKFPWIVIRPESVLQPGRVFFVVPRHTIYCLLQQKLFQYHQQSDRSIETSGSNHDPPSLQQKSHSGKHQKESKSKTCEQTHKTVSYEKESSEHEEYKKKQLDNNIKGNKHVEGPVGQKSSESLINTLEKLHSPKEDGDEPLKKEYPVERWPASMTNQKYCHQLFNLETSLADSSFEEIPITCKDYFARRDNPVSRSNSKSRFQSPKEAVVLKSCLKKDHQKNISRFPDRKVKFLLLEEDENYSLVRLKIQI